MQSPQADRRADLRTAQDEQSLETRRRLVEAFRTAAAEDVARPSVTWICERSGVGRSTFYTHFATVDDLAVFAITETFAATSASDVAERTTHGQDRRDITRAGLSRVVDALEATRDDLEYAVRIGSRAAVTERLVAEFASFTSGTVAAEFGDRSRAERDLVTGFVSAATVQGILWWLANPATMDRDAFIELLVELLPTQLTVPGS
jgi:AcrR family transcriptional regulator